MIDIERKEESTCDWNHDAHELPSQPFELVTILSLFKTQSEQHEASDQQEGTEEGVMHKKNGIHGWKLLFEVDLGIVVHQDSTHEGLWHQEVRIAKWEVPINYLTEFVLFIFCLVTVDSYELKVAFETCVEQEKRVIHVPSGIDEAHEGDQKDRG